MIRTISLTILLSLLSVNEIISQPVIKAVFTEKSPKIDGILDDDVWQNASLINDLYQREPNPGDAVSEKTEFYFLYDHQ